MMTTEDVKEIFLDEYGDSTNFVTDEVLEYVVIKDDMVAELSFGAGDPSSPLFKMDTYGVTVMMKVDGEWVRAHTVEKGLSDMFYSMDEARGHIKELKER